MPHATLLLCHDRYVNGPFGLLSRNENGLTFALGFLLARHKPLLIEFLRELRIPCKSVHNININLQKGCSEEDIRGITDVEIQSPDFYLIIEAKKASWPLPDQ